MDQYDYIIVGAGSAGCVLANRLSADPTTRVLLVEAGGRDSHPYFGVPKGIAKLRLHPEFSWCFPVEPSLGRNSGEIWPRGRALGGTSSINGMFYVRGQPADYDAWESLGNRGWNWRALVQCFVQMEDHALGPTSERGVGGPLHVSAIRAEMRPNEALIEAGMQAGLPRKSDLNEGDQAGIGYYCLNTFRSKRWSASDAFLHPISHRQNLTVLTKAMAERVLFDGRRAVGLSCRTAAGSNVYRARGEVILSAGTVKSPQLLMLSGIGDTEQLRRHGVKILHHSPRVGRQVREHLSMTVSHRLRGIAGENREYRGLRLGWNVIRYYLAGSGPLSWSTFPVGGFARSRASAPRPDVQFFLGALSYDGGGRDKVTARVAPGKLPGLTCFAYYLHPTSEGRISLRSADASAPPLIEPNWLATEEDRRASVDTVRLMRRILSQPALSPYLGDEVTPGPEVENNDDALLRAYVRFGSTANHAIGSCAMGPHPESVVDDRLRVRGVEGLRVVDLSVFPTLPSGNTNGPVMAAAWHAADLIAQAVP